MTRTTSVSSYTRRLPEKAPDPFASIIEAKKPRFAAKWGVELVGTDDERLQQPIAPPLLDGRQMTMSEITRQLKALARFAKSIGRTTNADPS